MKRRKLKRSAVRALLLGSLVWGGALAVSAEEPSHPAPGSAEPQEESASSEGREPQVEIFEHVLVTGGPAEVENVPGSAVYLGAEELSEQGHGDLHRILWTVPGVQVVEEEGYGLRPNIGMRGTGTERSQKVTLLEDGVPIAPAPYAAPAAYYVPTAGRMAAVEVRKGSAAVKQGPYTNGGVINLVSSGIPAALGGGIDAVYGEDDTRRLHASVGASAGRWGWLAETYQFDTDGFKELDGGGDTGVKLGDYLGKLRLTGRPGSRRYQAVELKLGRTDQDGRETYLGLAPEDFARHPLRRYAASREDRIETEHEQLQLRYFAQPTSSLHLIGTVYRNDFFRNWHKLQSVAGVGIASVLDRPEQHPDELALLRGEVDVLDGGLRIRNNRRDYSAEGVELVVGWQLEAGGVAHGLELGLRDHRDYEDRFQDEESWNLRAGEMELVGVDAPGSQSNRIDAADATALYLSDEIVFGRLTLSPGVRYESIDFERRDFGRLDPGRTGAALNVQETGVDELVPGLGATWALSSRWTLVGGVHRGFAPPGAGQSPGTRAEKSINWETGFNFRGGRWGARVIAFFSDYDNLLGRDTLSSGGGGTGDAFSGGEVEVRGLEASLDGDLGRVRGWSLSVPLRASFSFTRSEFRSSFETAFEEWAPAVEAGDQLPYVPEHQLSLSVGAVGEAWSAFLGGNWTSEVRTVAGRGPIPDSEGLGAHAVFDLSLRRRLRSGLDAVAQVRNLGDATYVAARRPAGARPGLPRTTLLGLEWRF